MYETSSYINIDSNYRDKNNFLNPFYFTVLETQVETWLKLGGCKQREEAVVKVERMTIPYPRIDLFATSFVEVQTVAGTDMTYTIQETPVTLSIGDILECVIQPKTTTPFTYGARYQVASVTPLTLTLVGSATVLSTANQTYTGTNRLRFAIVTSTASNQLTAALELIKMPQIFIDFYSKGYNDLDLIDTVGGNIRNAKFIVYTHNTLIQKDENDRPIWIHYSCDTPQTLRFKKNDAVTIRLQDRNGKTINIYSDTTSNLSKQMLMTISLKW